jgi:protoheme IX farnesyltransferase
MKEDVLKHNIVSESSIRDYISLLKPRVMSLVVFTAVAGLYLAPSTIHPFIALVSILCTSLGSGAAGCLNMWYDRDIDSIMLRTKSRPIVTGIVEESEALALGIFLSIISVVGMMVCVNIISGLILALSIGFYYFIYTVWLKRSTIQNIVIGGAAGSFPPIIGWTSVTGSIDLDAIILFLIIFLWTPPHFWALALYKSDDYKRAKIPMMPVICGADYTKNQIVIYSIFMALSSFLPFFTGLVGYSYFIVCAFLNIYFLYLAVKLKYSKDGNDSNSAKIAPKLFGYSIIYLFAIFGTLMISKFIGF